MGAGGPDPGEPGQRGVRGVLHPVLPARAHRPAALRLGREQAAVRPAVPARAGDSKPGRR